MKNYVALLALVLTSSVLQAAPAVTSVSPISAPASQTTLVTITGSGFTGATAVHFGTVSATPTVVNDSTIQATAPVGVPGAVNVTVTAGAATSPVVRGDIFTYTGSWVDDIVLQATNSTMTALAVPSNTVGASAQAAGPAQGIAISPDGRLAAVVSSTGVMTYLNRANNFNEAILSVITNDLTAVAISIDGAFAYVADIAHNTVIKVNLSTFSQQTIPVNTAASSLLLTPNNEFLYAADGGAGTVSVVDLATNTVTKVIGGFSSPQAMRITPDGTSIYVACANSGTVQVIDTATNSVIASPITVGTGPFDLAITSDGAYVYVVNALSSTLSKIDTATNTAITTPAQFSSEPVHIALTPDNAFAYITMGNSVSSISQVNLSTFAVSTAATRAAYTQAITPDQAPVAAFTSTTGISPIQFDASQSVSPTGTIATYSWDFGDGTMATTASPTIAHTYQQAGTYTAALTVTNSAGTSTTQSFTGQTASRNGSSFAFVSKSVTASGAPLPVSIASPAKFSGKIKRRHGQVVLQVQWKNVDSAVSYQIYRKYKKIRTISANSALYAALKITPSAYYKKHLHELQKRLKKHYRIRAVSASGIVSKFRRIQF